ncbi:hypothetical protein [Bacillus thuringiensis]|uniref:Uncharacterized protein n=1 Tax=Bacillus thuringiensis TaxID=1428 RepID=A0A9X6V9T9_BACTU|nr:hypothetical protein [Bacillus thuringiensis]MCU5281480.1 hypothetical protein [Bacillus cereus]MEC3271469.1 hypothetical protein [Bacillus thuringiensis]PFB02265.1 hypothetical protein CN398_17580 [Bacillus thuringiensis]
MATAKKQKEPINIDIKISTPKQALQTRKELMEKYCKREIEKGDISTLLYALQGASVEHRSMQEAEKIKIEREKVTIQERAVAVSEEMKTKLEDRVKELEGILEIEEQFRQENNNR